MLTLITKTTQGALVLSAINISDMIWPSSSCAFDLHLQSTVMISIVTGLTPLDLHRSVVVVSPTITSTTIATA